jgi:hypothetical protein
MDVIALLSWRQEAAKAFATNFQRLLFESKAKEE